MPAFKRPSAPSSIDTRPASASTNAASPSNSVMSSKHLATAGKVQDEQTAVQSPPLSPFLHMREDKDALAIAHDRQRYFKSLDRARVKARKAFGLEASRSLPGTINPEEGRKIIQKKGQQQQRMHHGAQERSVNVGDEKEFWKAVGGDDTTTTGPTSPGLTCHIPELVGVFNPPQVEVKLADLVQVRKTNSGAKKKGSSGGLGGDYEVIPQVRSVIILDDHIATGGAAMGKGREMEVEDAWECIDEEDVFGRQRPTYATIAAAGLAV